VGSKTNETFFVSAPPLPTAAMTKVQDFVVALARAVKGYNEIKNTTDSAFGAKSMSKSVIYKIINKLRPGKTRTKSDI
jgi:hypothetical protein